MTLLLTTTAANLFIITLLITTVTSQSYSNHTVGDSAGWLFNSDTNTTSTDYTKWASTQVFNLGDYLIFNTTTNQTVVQTYNETTYNSCDTEDALDTDTFIYQGENVFGQPLVIQVPLTKEGTNYFFSDANDGLQCSQNMKFEIDVKHGIGLPSYLNQPPPPPYVEPPQSSDSNPTPSSETSSNSGFRDSGNVPLGVLIVTSVLGFLLLLIP
ncbi:early nodulin-like protein [Thalictrum thalictroides]|uniref:Early nodulin-like protein n=1 Tax=Thalictrum thalictroides TaxID=46969 RepID=A0A7J6W3K6_THATH|nr:early nodulin-like protein [Thalictrum thalictroides]